jgi:2-phosphosulfolactate phosphatase
VKKDQRSIIIREGEEGARKAAKSGDITVVIDVLRMSSTIVTALAHGAIALKPVVSVEEARTYKLNQPSILIGGERGGLRPASFDLGNSPREYTTSKVKGKKVVITTSNGTRVLGILQKSNSTSPVIIASALNVSASAKKTKAYAKSLKRNITLLAAGRVDLPSPEDHIIAHIIREFLITGKTTLTSKAARKFFRESPHGKELREKGLGKDIDFCAQIDRYDIVPVVNEDYEIIKD